jgi:shikimate dehydrogenase
MTMSLSGATRLYAIIGDPIVQVRSPEVYTERFLALGHDAVLFPAHVLPDRFDATVAGLMALANLDGLLVTSPYKGRMVSHAARLGITAESVGAVNALRREADGSWAGDMFDGAGLVHGIERRGASVRGRRTLVFGAGGAGSAIAAALAQAGVRSLRVVDPDAERSGRLLKTLRRLWPDCESDSGEPDPADRNLIVNASTIGMRPDDPMPAPLGPLSADVIVADAVLSETPTALIRHAAECGCPCFDGRDMHSGQVEAILEFLLGTRGS